MAAASPMRPWPVFSQQFFASTLVNGKAHAVPLAVSNRSKWLTKRTDRNGHVWRAPVDRDHGFASCVQQKIGRLAFAAKNGYGADDREPSHRASS